MRINKEERYQIKLIRLAKEVYCRTGDWASYEYTPSYEPHRFAVFKLNIQNHVVFIHEDQTAKSCYERAVEECRKAGLI